MQVLGLEFRLTSDMFTTDFKNISSEKAWNKAVSMVDALGLDYAKFTIVKNGTKAWAFKDVDGDGNLINLPKTAELKVIDTTGNKAQKLVLDAVGNWPISEDFIVDMDVEINKNLTVADVLNVTDGHKIYNGATIYAGKNATIGDKESQTTEHVPNHIARQDSAPSPTSTTNNTGYNHPTENLGQWSATPPSANTNAAHTKVA